MLSDRTVRHQISNKKNRPHKRTVEPRCHLYCFSSSAASHFRCAGKTHSSSEKKPLNAVTWRTSERNNRCSGFCVQPGHSGATSRYLWLAPLLSSPITGTAPHHSVCCIRTRLKLPRAVWWVNSVHKTGIWRICAPVYADESVVRACGEACSDGLSQYLLGLRIQC
jgi:hypothetical protein